MSECVIEEGTIRIPPLPQHVTKLGISLIEETNTSLIEQIFDESGYAPGLQTLVIKGERALVLDDHREAVSTLLQACKARGISLLWETTGEAVLPEEPEKCRSGLAIRRNMALQAQCRHAERRGREIQQAESCGHSISQGVVNQGADARR